MNTYQNIDFNDTNLYIGIDVHKKNWEIAIRCNGIQLKRFNMEASVNHLAAFLNKTYPNANFIAVYEAGFCGFWICRQLCDLGIHCTVVNPADVPTSQKEKVNKNDRIDAGKLSRELEKNSLQDIYIPDPFNEQLRSLMRFRKQLAKERTRTKNRIKALLYYYGYSIPAEFADRNWSGHFINYLKHLHFRYDAGKQTLDRLVEMLEYIRLAIKDTLKALRELAKDPLIHPTIKALISVPGVAFITAMTFYTEIMDIKRFSNFDKLASFVGLVPSRKGSGEIEYDRGITFRKNKILRPLLIEAAWVAAAADPALTMKYNQLRKTMSKQKAIIRIAKKLLSRMRYVWMNQKEYVKAVIK
jgi:transposase